MYTHFTKYQTMLDIWVVCLKKLAASPISRLLLKNTFFYNDIQKMYFRIYGMIQKSRVERALMTAHQVWLFYNFSLMTLLFIVELSSYEFDFWFWRKTLTYDFKVARQPLGQGPEVTHIQERHLLSKHLVVGFHYVMCIHTVLAMDMDGGDDCY